MTYSHTSRRLVTDAKIVLERAGYAVQTNKGYYRSEKTGKLCGSSLRIGDHPAWLPHKLDINGGTVCNDELLSLLAARGCNGHGYKNEKV
jgi:hypothetical protein